MKDSVKTPEIVAIDERFCWKKLSFPGWEKIIPGFDTASGKVIANNISFAIAPYRGDTPDWVVGDGTRYLAVEYLHLGSTPAKQHVDGYIVWENNSYRVMCGNLLLEAHLTVEAAIASLLKWNKDERPFTPRAAYCPPDGRLQAIMEDPQTVAAVICGWKNYRRERFSLLPVTDECNLNAGRLLRLKSIPAAMEKLRAAQEFRAEDAKFDYSFTLLPLRSDHRAFASESRNHGHDHDSYMVILGAECTKNAAALEFFKNHVMTIGEDAGVRSVFIKEGNSHYMLGCSHEEFFLRYNDDHIDQIKNYGEKSLTYSGTAWEGLFCYLDIIYNDSLAIFAPNNRGRVSIEAVSEELPGVGRAFSSFSDARRYYSGVTPYIRRQWLTYYAQQDGSVSTCHPTPKRRKRR